MAIKKTSEVHASTTIQAKFWRTDNFGTSYFEIDSSNFDKLISITGITFSWLHHFNGRNYVKSKRCVMPQEGLVEYKVNSYEWEFEGRSGYYIRVLC
jgi:hypothetical protein